MATASLRRGAVLMNDNKDIRLKFKIHRKPQETKRNGDNHIWMSIKEI